jgi:hypothetical protein
MIRARAQVCSFECGCGMLLCEVVMYGVLVLFVRAEELDRQFMSWTMSRFVLSSG